MAQLLLRESLKRGREGGKEREGGRKAGAGQGRNDLACSAPVDPKRTHFMTSAATQGKKKVWRYAKKKKRSLVRGEDPECPRPRRPRDLRGGGNSCENLAWEKGKSSC